MQTISFTKLDDIGWQKYFQMTQGIMQKYYPGKNMIKDTWQQYKYEKLKSFESSKNVYFNEYVIFEETSPVAWVDHASASYSSGFSFDTIYEDIPDCVLKEILKIIYNFIIDAGFDEIRHWTYSERRINFFRKINLDIHEELLLSRLAREDMNADFYKGIINKYDNLNGFEIHFLNEIDDGLMDKYVKFVNEMFDDIDKLNPVRQDKHYLNRNDWIRILNMNKEAGSKMNMYMMYNSFKEIAALCINYIDSNFRENIRHSGGLTAVGRSFRGKGFGRYLKAKMYFKMLEENNDFKFITTDTMPWNKFMYRINEEFGFKPFKRGCIFRMTKQLLENYLK